MNAVMELEALGYVVKWSKNGISYSYDGPKFDVENSGKILELLGRIKEHKDLALAFLQRRQFATEPARPLEELHEYLQANGLRLTGVCEFKDGIAMLAVEAM